MGKEGTKDKGTASKKQKTDHASPKESAKKASATGSMPTEATASKAAEPAAANMEAVPTTVIVNAKQDDEMSVLNQLTVYKMQS